MHRSKFILKFIQMLWSVNGFKERQREKKNGFTKNFEFCILRLHAKIGKNLWVESDSMCNLFFFSLIFEIIESFLFLMKGALFT